MDDLLSFAEALGRVLEHAGRVRLPTAERLPLLEARTRVLAESLRGDRDQPPFDRSTRDGFAVLAAGGLRRRVVGTVRAGEQWAGEPLDANGAIEIMTGAPLPAGADAVVMVEHVERDGDTVLLAGDRLPVAGQNIVPRGAELRAGEVALAAGVRLGAAEIATAASIGAAEVEVYRRPAVGVLATGDELVEMAEQPGPQQIRNSNSYALAALVEAAGGRARRLPIVRDTRAALRAAIGEARAAIGEARAAIGEARTASGEARAESDLLLLSGGVSAGTYDLVEEVLAEFGAEFFFTGVRLQPGKPVVFGLLPGFAPGSAPGSAPRSGPRPDERGRTLPFFGLPGNPVSTQVTFACFVAPLLRAMAGEPARAPLFVMAKLAESVSARPGLTRLLPAEVLSGLEGATVRLVVWQGSGDQAANARGNGYVLLPDRAEPFAAGELVSVLLR